MTINEAKEELRSIYFLNNDIEMLYDKIVRLRSSAEKVTQIISDMPKGSDTRQLDDIIAQIDDLCYKYAARSRMLHGILTAFEEAVNAMSDARLRQVLELRYLKRERWEVIAVKTSYYYRSIFKVHGKALREYAKLRSESEQKKY